MDILSLFVGLILYSGQMTDGSGDFVSFGMRNRRAEFRLDVGSGPAVITSDPLELDRWYTVRVRRERKEGRRAVTTPPCILSDTTLSITLK